MPLGSRAWGAASPQVVNTLWQAVSSKTFHDEANGGLGVVLVFRRSFFGGERF